MSNEEFENYISLMGKILRLSQDQREQIKSELHDHLQMRVNDLMADGATREEAMAQTIDEFGDAAAMANNFQTVMNFHKRRWMMRFVTFSIVGSFLAAVLAMAMWPNGARFGSPNESVAQQAKTAATQPQAAKKSNLVISDASRRNLATEQILKKSATFSYDENPFSEVQEELGERFGITILLDDSAKEDSLDVDEPITLSLHEIQLGKALELMLRMKNAFYFIDEGVVVVASRDEIDDPRWMRVKMFNCRELVEKLPPSLPIQGLIAPSKTPKELEQAKQLPRPKASSEQTLLNLIYSNVEPDSWFEYGSGMGTASVVNGVLVVNQHESVLRRIENLLTDLEGQVLGRIQSRVAAVGQASSRSPDKSADAVEEKVADQPQGDPFRENQPKALPQGDSGEKTSGAEGNPFGRPDSTKG